MREDVTRTRGSLTVTKHITKWARTLENKTFVYLVGKERHDAWKSPYICYPFYLAVYKYLGVSQLLWGIS